MKAAPLLRPPPTDLGKQVLVTRNVHVSKLFRISRHSSGEPYFGRAASNRFDDNEPEPSRRFGTSYCGFDLVTALAETLLHDEMPEHGIFHLSPTEFTGRNLVRFNGSGTLTVARLNGLPLKRLGGTGAISTIVPYDLPQQWSRAVHEHGQQVDGILYMSRHVNDRAAVVIFDRAAAKLGAASYLELPRVPGHKAAFNQLGIKFDRP